MRSLCTPSYVDVLRGFTDGTCTLRNNRKVPALDARSLSTCPVGLSPTPQVVVLSSAMHDIASPQWRGMADYEALWDATITTWKELLPTTARIAVRTAPMPSKAYRNEVSILSMANQAACRAAVRHGVTCLDPFPALYPFADTNYTDGHHWCRGVSRQPHSGCDGTSYVGEAYQSYLYSFLCL